MHGMMARCPLMIAPFSQPIDSASEMASRNASCRMPTLRVIGIAGLASLLNSRTGAASETCTDKPSPSLRAKRLRKLRRWSRRGPRCTPRPSPPTPRSWRTRPSPLHSNRRRSHKVTRPRAAMQTITLPAPAPAAPPFPSPPPFGWSSVTKCPYLRSHVDIDPAWAFWRIPSRAAWPGPSDAGHAAHTAPTCL